MKSIIKKLFGKVDVQPEDKPQPKLIKTTIPPVQIFEQSKLLTNPFQKL